MLIPESSLAIRRLNFHFYLVLLDVPFRRLWDMRLLDQQGSKARLWVTA